MGYVMMRRRKACNYPNLRSFGWVSYDRAGVLYSGKLGNRSEARTCLRSQKLSGALVGSNKKATYHYTKAKKVSTLQGPAQLANLQGALCVPAPITLQLLARVTPSQ